MNNIEYFIARLFASRQKRRRLRYERYLPRIALHGSELPPLKKRKIDVAFCFDKNYAKLAAVAIMSLLDVSKNRCDYRIHCVVDEGVGKLEKDRLEKIARDSGSEIAFLNANEDFDKSLRGNWSKGIWYRLMLPKLLPDLDRIIYADVDTAFCNDLVEADMIDLGGNLIAAANDGKPGSINSGFLIMNLKLMRRENIYKKWISLSRANEYMYPDQDLLNETCKDRILHLPLKYNFCLWRRPNTAPYSEQELSDLRFHCVMMHWLGAGPKPWKHYDDSRYVPFADIWRYYADKTGF
ncbi:MAG: glycosyltransferase family 8 protein [Rickettsiales bacterium]|jgi:lipopolysaccharide biosynthesis glycosyltransferase|nr:glycosyltransferase family 8 protein [Rickettsiales bacterium]